MLYVALKSREHWKWWGGVPYLGGCVDGLDPIPPSKTAETVGWVPVSSSSPTAVISTQPSKSSNTAVVAGSLVVRFRSAGDGRSVASALGRARTHFQRKSWCVPFRSRASRCVFSGTSGACWTPAGSERRPRFQRRSVLELSLERQVRSAFGSGWATFLSARTVRCFQRNLWGALVTVDCTAPDTPPRLTRRERTGRNRSANRIGRSREREFQRK